MLRCSDDYEAFVHHLQTLLAADSHTNVPFSIPSFTTRIHQAFMRVVPVQWWEFTALVYKFSKTVNDSPETMTNEMLETASFGIYTDLVDLQEFSGLKVGYTMAMGPCVRHSGICIMYD